MDSPVFNYRLKQARWFLALAVISCIALIEAVMVNYPCHDLGVIGFGILTPFYLFLSFYWYGRLWQWVRFRKQHPAHDGTELHVLFEQARKRCEASFELVPVQPKASTLADAFDEPPAQN